MSMKPQETATTVLRKSAARRIPAAAERARGIKVSAVLVCAVARLCICNANERTPDSGVQPVSDSS